MSYVGLDRGGYWRVTSKASLPQVGGAVRFRGVVAFGEGRGAELQGGIGVNDRNLGAAEARERVAEAGPDLAKHVEAFLTGPRFLGTLLGEVSGHEVEATIRHSRLMIGRLRRTRWEWRAPAKVLFALVVSRRPPEHRTPLVDMPDDQLDLLMGELYAEEVAEVGWPGARRHLRRLPPRAQVEIAQSYADLMKEVERLSARPVLSPPPPAGSKRRGRGARAQTAEEAAAVFERLGAPLSHGSLAEIKQHYRALARKLHPDVRPEGEREAATRQISELNGAYEVLVRLLGEKEQERAQETRQSFDLDAYLREAMRSTQRAMEEAVTAAVGWQPPVGTRGVTREALRAWAQEALAHGFVRVQRREYTPHDPATNPFTGGASQGYHGVVTSTRTLAPETPEYLATVVELIVKATAPAWRGDPLALVSRLTLQAPRGENPGHAAVMWVAGQDWTGQMFGWSTRWHSLSVAPRPARKPAIPKEEKLDRAAVENMLRGAGMTDLTPRAWKAKRWAFPEATRSYRSGFERKVVTYRPEIETKAKVLRVGGGEPVYYGQVTRAQIEEYIRWARGTAARGQADRRGQGARPFVQSGKAFQIPVRKARAVGIILATNGSGTHETWEVMDAWVVAEGLGTVLEQIGWLYAANGSEWTDGEQRWWISQLAPEQRGGGQAALSPPHRRSRLRRERDARRAALREALQHSRRGLSEETRRSIERDAKEEEAARWWRDD